ncbi:MAG: DNA (cytosine-5-)-methyltransferase [Muribaculaceae bacterium]|nr:DNA (cytosine-5-)-methyltransferase [Muribaculaceae bacterium]
METKNFKNYVNGNTTNTVVSNSVIAQNSPQNIDWDGTPWIERKPSCLDKVVTIGTSCSGIGAPEQALIALQKEVGLKYEIKFAGDIDRNVKKSYFANYDITEDRWHDDLRTFNAAPYKDEISILICGVCCQPFSKAGKLEGTEDEEKGNLAKSMCEVIKTCQPKIWMMENVDNMLTCGEGKHWKIIKGWFDETGYDIHYQVLNALDYGVPQNRNRLFVVGFKEPNPDFKFPAPIKLDKCIRDILEDKTPAYRRLTPREALRLQGFSDDFKIVVPDYAAYHQAGNSIAVPVLKAIFSQMDITKYGF